MSRLRHTALYEIHAERGARFGPFAGYEMPLTFAGAVAEHLHTRAAASLFDVSHMGVMELRGTDPAAALETLAPGGITTLAPDHMRYTFFTNPGGGILDDLIATRRGDHVGVVANAARVEHDLSHLRRLDGIEVVHRRDLHLLALQGPESAAALAALGTDLSGLRFMQGRVAEVGGQRMWVGRSGYTGEDGFELAVPDDVVHDIARALLADERVEPAGLAARDSLRLEAGLCLYGSDIDETTSPVEAGLMWAVPKRRRETGGFPGADVVDRQLTGGVERKRVGLAIHHRRPIRHGYELTGGGEVVGVVTSGGFGPSIGAPVAMGYVHTAHAETGSRLTCDARGTKVPVEVVDLPFVEPRYVR